MNCTTCGLGFTEFWSQALTRPTVWPTADEVGDKGTSKAVTGATRGGRNPSRTATSSPRLQHHESNRVMCLALSGGRQQMPLRDGGHMGSVPSLVTRLDQTLTVPQ